MRLHPLHSRRGSPSGRFGRGGENLWTSSPLYVLCWQCIGSRDDPKGIDALRLGARSNSEPGGEQTLLLAATHVLLRPHPQVLHALLHTLAALEEIRRKRYVLSSVGA